MPPPDSRNEGRDSKERCMEHPISLDRLTAGVQKICRPNAPPQLRAMAASGLAPLKPIELVTALYVLSYDADVKIGEKAKKSLQGMPDNVVFGVMEQLEEPEVIDGVVRLLGGKIEAYRRIILNQHTAAETVVWLVGELKDDRTLELVAANEARMLKHPQIIEALYKNPITRMSTVDRAVELAIRNGVELSGIPSFKELKVAIQGELIPEPTDTPTPDDVMFAGSLNAETWKDLDEESVDAALGKEKDETLDETQRKVESVEQTLSRLSISSKIRVATLGSSTQRAVLIRDSNKLVVLAVLKSPTLNESEVRRFSRFRTLPEEAVRHIAGSREWTKHYSVKLNLVQNPRCPIEYALRFMPHLRVSDLKSLSRDKNIPHAVARAAKQLLQKRMR
jgi:hypothetical protein